MSTTYVNQVNSTPIYATRAASTTKGVDIDSALEGIQAIIPAAASASNKLADKNYVDNATGASGSYEIASLTTGENPHPDVAEPTGKKIYLTKDSTSTATDPYTEWIYLAPVAPETVGTWEIIGETSVDLSGYKTVQTAVPDPNVPESGTTTALSFIDTITQNTNGVITATKKNVAITDSYDGTGATPVNGKAVKAALDTLDVTVTGMGAGKTLSALSETGGKIAATFQDISITKSQVSDFPSTMTPSSHTHGNIQDDGTLQTADASIGSGDKLVITDSSDSNKVARASVSFDGSTVTTALTPKGTFEAFAKSGDIASAINALDAEVTSNDGTNVQVKVTETDGAITGVSVATDNTENRNNKVTSWSSTTTDTNYPSEKLVKAGLDAKQDTLSTQTAYTEKGTATKVPQITTNSLGQVTGITEVTISGVTPASHAHGNIANDGTLTDTAAAASGNDYVVIRDADDAKIQTSTIKGTDVADAVDKKHSHATLTLSTTAQAYDGTHTLALPASDPYTSERTPASHTHGNIQNGGTLQTSDVTIATGDKLVITDSSDSNKVARASVEFDGSTVTKALTQKGTFETFLTSHQDISGKADKVSGATNGNLAALDANGNLVDSTSKASDFAPAFETLAVNKGRTGSSTAQGARTNLDVYSKTETESLVHGQTVIVSTLPATGESGKCYYLKVGSSAGADNYEEYIWGTEPSGSSAGWIKVGDRTVDLSNYKQKQSAVSDPSPDGTGLTFIDAISQDADGVIEPHKKTVAVDQTFSASSTNPISGAGVAAAIGTLDVPSTGTGAITGMGAGKTLQTLTETDGKISATFQDISIDSTQISDLSDTYDHNSGTAISGKGVADAISGINIIKKADIIDMWHSIAVRTIGTLGTYPVCYIGGKQWMSSNLDATSISGIAFNPSGTPSTASCWYYNGGSSEYADGYGALYNWAAAKYINDNRATLCPGWHVPTRDELTALLAYAGSSQADRIVALCGTEMQGSDDLCFNILGSGVKDTTNGYSGAGSTACLWSIESAYALYVDPAQTSISVTSKTATDGFSIRLVRD